MMTGNHVAVWLQESCRRFLSLVPPACHHSHRFQQYFKTSSSLLPLVDYSISRENIVLFNSAIFKLIPYSPTIKTASDFSIFASYNNSMSRRDLDRVFDLLSLEDRDRNRSLRHNRHDYGSHHEPVYMSGGLHPRDDIGDYARGRAGLHRNWYNGGWDLDSNWSGGRVSAARPDMIRDSIAHTLDGPRPRGRNISLREAERDWYGVVPADGFRGYHPGWYGGGGCYFGGNRWRR